MGAGFADVDCAAAAAAASIPQSPNPRNFP